MSDCIVVIPIYKEKPSSIEISSFKQCLKILYKHTISIITHPKLDLKIYKKIADEHNINLHIKYFNETYFYSVKGYNQLCLDIQFYKSFRQYKYILIYQLDAWVFKDDLDFWCSKGYDYIGAPFFQKDKSRKFYTKKITGIGNGGFSLRKIEYCIKLLNSNNRIPFLHPLYLWKKYYANKIPSINIKNIIPILIIMLRYILNIIGYQNNLKYLVKHKNEDYIFSEYATNSLLKIKPFIPNFKEASLFAFEVNPSYLYSQHNILPFGCHAFKKHEFDHFWIQHIKLE